MKAVLISIQPKWCELIASGKKTIEVRKTRPKIETPFKCYIYCTIGNGVKGDYLVPSGIQCGKVIGEFVCNRIDEYFYDQAFDESMGCFIDKYGYEITSYELAQTCLSYEEFEKYGNTNALYGWHISDLKIYDKPKELSEFRYHCKYEYDDDFKHCYGCDYHYFSDNPSSGREEYCCCDGLKRITRPPQSWFYCEDLGE